MNQLGTLPRIDPDHFTRAQALARGETDRSLGAALRAGLIVRLRHGAYAPADGLADLEERERHLLLARAVLDQQRGPVALDGPSAALLQGFDVFGHDLGVVHLMRLDGGSGRREAGVVHRDLEPAVATRVEVHAGLVCVSPQDAIWRVARLSALEGGVVTADSALHAQPELEGPLKEIAAAGRAQPGSRTARMAVRLARPEAESVGESLTRVACFRHGIPCPTLQHEVFDHAGRLLGRSDFYWEEFRLLGEFDGEIKYGRLLKKGETATKALVDERRRENKMISTGRGMARFAWSEVLPRVASRRMGELRHELDQSRRLYVRSPD